MAMPPLMKSVVGTRTVSMEAAQPSSTVAVRAQVETKTVSERAACARPPNRALTLSKQTSKGYEKRREKNGNGLGELGNLRY